MDRRMRFRIRRKSLAFWTGVLIVVVYLIWSRALPVQINLTSADFHELRKCPACYGEDFCLDFFSEKLTLTNWTRFSIARWFNAKNVFYADYNGLPVVIKKLAHDDELRSFDSSVCRASKIDRPTCRPEHHIRFLTSRVTLEHKYKSLDVAATRQLVSLSAPDSAGAELMGCMRSQQLIDYLVQRASAYHVGKSNGLDYLLTMLMVNPEPLMLMAFPPEDGWPVPKYYGSCGRNIVVQNAGRRLTEFVDAPFTSRVHLALQLLRMASLFSKNSLNLALYLTDWSTDNFAVDERLVLTVVDLEHVVLVNLTQVKEVAAPGWDVEHTSSLFGCSDCFSYSVEDLCSHASSDHNVFGVCKGILAPHSFSRDMPHGLLHSVPGDVKLAHPLFERLLKECATPSHPAGRMEAAGKLMDILSLI